MSGLHRRNLGWIVLGVLALGGIGSVLVRNVQNQRRIVAFTKAFENWEIDRRAAILEHDALLTLLNNRSGRVLANEGSQATPALLGRVSEQDGIVYLIRTTCGACPLNYPALRRLDSLAPGKISIVAVDPEGDLETYVAEQNLSFRYSRMADTELVDGLPVYSTPITLAIADGKVANIITGRIDSARESELARLLSQLAN